VPRTAKPQSSFADWELLQQGVLLEPLLQSNVARLITAYQEGLVSLAQLRQRMPELNKKSQSVESELQSLETAAVDQARYLQLAESLDGFRIKLRARAKTLDVCERQQILRLLVKEVLVAADSLTIRHSIPIPQTGPVSNGPQLTGSHPSGTSQKPGYLLRSRSRYSSLSKPAGCVRKARCAGI
jgi:site-specific DNA recombinase